MTKEENNEVYLDLFDDTFYDLNKLVHGEGHERKLAVVRLHLLLWIIMGKTIVVPEQWALSSRLCQIVIDEMADSFLRFCKYTKRTNMQFPVRIQSIYRPRHENHKHSGLEIAMKERLALGSRLIFDEALDPTKSDDATALRAALSEVIAGHTVSELIAGKDDYIEMRSLVSDKFAKKLAEKGLANKLDEYSLPLISGTLAFHVSMRGHNRFELKSVRKSVDLNGQAINIGKYVEAVHSVVFSEKYRDNKGERLEAIRAMFNKADTDGIPRAAIMRMWEMIATFDQRTRIFIERLGRFCLHSAIGDQYNVAYGTNGMAGGLDNKPFDDFERNFQTDVRDHLTQSLFDAPAHTTDAMTLIPKYLTLPDDPENKYFDFRRVPWETMWQELWEYLYESEWADEREKLAKDLESAMSSSDEDTQAEWDRIFSEICNRFSMIKFRRSTEHSTIGHFTVAAVEEIEQNIKTSPEDPGALLAGSLVDQASLALNLPSIIHLISQFPAALSDLRLAGADTYLPVYERRRDKILRSMLTLGGVIGPR